MPRWIVCRKARSHCEFSECPATEYIWGFKEIPSKIPVEEGDEGARTEVTLKIRDKIYDLGSHRGSCSQIKGTGNELLPNEIDGIQCWLTETGVEIGIFMENGKLSVKKGILLDGGLYDDGVRGNFEVLFNL